MTTIGVLGGRWRATVSSAGLIEPWDGSPTLDWAIAADDRWHVPSSEGTARQVRVDGSPVIETRVRIPSGDAVQRIWCVADGGGFTIVEVENDSTLPFAVAFNRSDVLSARPPTTVPIEGIDLPEDSITFPVGHRSTIRIALAHAGQKTLPDNVSSAAGVARGWTAMVERAGRILVPDEAFAAMIAQLRCDLALIGPPEPTEDPVGFLIGVAQLVRMGERAEPWVTDVADAVAVAAKLPAAWDLDAALDSAGLVLSRAGEPRALRDLARLRATSTHPLPADAPTNRVLVWHELALARPAGPGLGELLTNGLPGSWLGANFEVFDLPVGANTTVSYALRWHGDRPAVLWETRGPSVRLTSPTFGWSTTESKGEALWPAPEPVPGATVPVAPDAPGSAVMPLGPDLSFS